MPKRTDLSVCACKTSQGTALPLSRNNLSASNLQRSRIGPSAHCAHSKQSVWPSADALIFKFKDKCSWRCVKIFCVRCFLLKTCKTAKAGDWRLYSHLLEGFGLNATSREMLREWEYMGILVRAHIQRHPCG